MEIYWSPQLLRRLVVDYQGKLWLVPTDAGGWERRVPCRGLRDVLRPVDPATRRAVFEIVSLPEEQP